MGNESFNQASPNPYAPPTIAAPVSESLQTDPGRFLQLSLSGPAIPFSGQVTKKEIAVALKNGQRYFLQWIFLVLQPMGLGVLIFLTGAHLGLVLSLLGFSLMLAYVYARQTGTSKLHRYLKTSPRALEPFSGEISPEGIRITSAVGWSEYRWNTVCGIQLRFDQITLALNPQHQAFVFMPRRLFSDSDWDRLFRALASLAPTLPFQINNRLQADSQLLATGLVPELGEHPDDSIMLEGMVTTSEILRSPLGKQIFWSWVWKSIVVACGVLFLLWIAGVIELLGYMAWLIALIPALIAYRVYKWLVAAGKDSTAVIKLRAAVSESVLALSTPRAKSCIYWPTFNDVVISDNLIALRESNSSNNIVPLPRSALVNSDQWEELVALVQRKVAEQVSN